MPLMHLALTVLVSSYVALVGCDDPVEPERTTQGSDGGHRAVDAPSNSTTTVRARMTALDAEYPWYRNSDAGHDDGTAPLATFVVVEPAGHADREVKILFLNKTEVKTPSHQHIGSDFSFQVPADFLTGSDTIIDNDLVKRLRKLTSPHDRGERPGSAPDAS